MPGYSRFPLPDFGYAKGEGWWITLRSSYKRTTRKPYRSGFTLAAILISLTLLTTLATGCGAGRNGDAGDASEQTEPANGTHPGQGQDGIPQTPPEDDPDTALDEQFVSLAETGAPVADLLTFMRTYKDQAGRQEMSAMLLIFEEKQLEQGYALEDRYYEQPDIQETLFDWYVKHQRLPRAADLPDGQAKQLLEDAEAGGFKTETAEGVFFPVIDYAVYKTFRSLVTEDVQAYIDLMINESDEPAVKDAALIIPWEEVARRALAFEAHADAYPDSARAQTADRLRMDYTYISFMGIDNSPLFDREGGQVVPAVLQAYKKVIREWDKKGTNGKKGNGDAQGNQVEKSRYMADLREFVHLIEAGDGKQTGDVRAFQEKVTEGLLDEYDERHRETEQ